MIAALLMLAQIVPAPAPAKPVETSIAAVLAEPAKFDGRVVRLRGYVNRCSALDCAIAERPSGTAEGPGKSLSIAANEKFDAAVVPLLPTYVEFDAQMSAACLTTAICTDRAPVLTIVTLRSVVSPEPPSFEN